MTLLGNTTLDGVWDTVLQKFVTAAYRPAMGDLGGENKTDDSQYPPDPSLNVTSANWLMLARTTIAVARTVPALVVNVGYDAGANPHIIGFRSTNSLLTTTTGTLAPVILISGSVGMVNITWPSGALPPSVTGTRVSVQGTVSSAIFVSVVSSNSAINNTAGVQITTRVTGSVLTAVPFSIMLDGELP